MEQGPLETTGRTVQEAVEAGLLELRIDLEDADVVVLNEARGGILGIGSELAKVQISIRGNDSVPGRDQRPPREEVTFVDDEDAERAREIVETLLDLMDVEVEVEIYNPSSDSNADGAGGQVVFDLFGEDAGLLIGRRGATLHDLQSIVTTMVSRTLGHYIPLRVDVEGYQQRRLDRAEQLALRGAERVEDRRRSITLDPMTPAERRIVHTTLADNEEVETQSSGEGEERRVTISPRGGEVPGTRGGGYGGRPGGRGRGPRSGPPSDQPRPPDSSPPPSQQSAPARPAFDEELGPMADGEDEE